LGTPIVPQRLHTTSDVQKRQVNFSGFYGSLSNTIEKGREKGAEKGVKDTKKGDCE
jgi:hypothetical protein